MSDLDIPADVVEEQKMEATEKEDYDEVEYMPPTAIGTFLLRMLF